MERAKRLRADIMETNEVLSGGGLGGLFDNMSTGALFASLLWGALGSGMALYGWKQKSMVPLFGGLVMIVVSYFLLSSALYMSLVSAAILAACIWLKKQGY
jgi:hypothetical protein